MNKHLAVAAFTIVLCGCERDPVDYDDCILMKMKASMSDGVANSIRAACRSRFSDHPESEDLHPSVVQKLTGKLGRPEIGNYWDGSIYNGNNEWTITEVTIGIVAQGKTENDYKFYKVGVSVSPLSNGTFATNIDWPPDAPYYWTIYTAKGYKVKN